MAKIADHKAFDVEFANAVQSIGASEKITKDLLKVYASLAIQAVHQFQNPDYLNRLRAVLTPVNKKTFTEFAIRFSGYTFDDEERHEFVGKSKKRYAAALELWNEFSEDPLKNIWTWAEREIVPNIKPFDPARLSKTFANAWKKAHEANISNVEILKAMLSVKDGKDGVVFSAQDIAEALQAMNEQAPVAGEKVAVPEPKPEQAKEAEAHAA